VYPSYLSQNFFYASANEEPNKLNAFELRPNLHRPLRTFSTVPALVLYCPSVNHLISEEDFPESKTAATNH
jgi:hypothetical protein